jgi:TonB family protein
MTLLLGLAIRTSIILAAGLLLGGCLAKRSAALRHRVLAATLLGTILVAPLSLALPTWNVPLPAADDWRDSSAMVEQSATTVGQAAASPRDAAQSVLPREAPAPPAAFLSAVIVIIWLVGVVIAAGSLIAGLVRIHRVAARATRIDDERWLGLLADVSTRYGLGREVVMARTDAADLVATWGILRPRVLLPSQVDAWAPERMYVVLCHELAHVRRHDWLVQMCAEAIRAVLWFNPLAWIACARLRRESEQACDDEVLGLGVGGRTYAAHLLELARQCRRPGSTWAAALPMAHPSTLERRIVAMLNPRLDRRVPSRRVLAALGAALLLVTLPIAAVRAGQPGPAPFTGTIYDATGAVMPGVTVALVDANELKWDATSAANGRFEFPAIGPGEYVLEVALVGFRTLRQNVELRDARDWERAVTLQVGSLQETVTVRASRETVPKHLKAWGTQGPVRVGGNIRAPKKIRDVRPVYPASMRTAGLTGVVPVEAVIGRDGTVTSVRVLSAQVHPDFAIAAVDAVRQWQFTPTLLNRVPVDVVITVSVRFDLD